MLKINVIKIKFHFLRWKLKKLDGYPKTEIVKPKTEPKLAYENRTEPKPIVAKPNRTENRKIPNRAGPIINASKTLKTTIEVEICP